MAKGMGIKTSVKSGNFRATKKGAGMTEKGVKAYRRANPGSKLNPQSYWGECREPFYL